MSLIPFILYVSNNQKAFLSKNVKSRFLQITINTPLYNVSYIHINLDINVINWHNMIIEILQLSYYTDAIHMKVIHVSYKCFSYDRKHNHI